MNYTKGVKMWRFLEGLISLFFLIKNALFCDFLDTKGKKLSEEEKHRM